MKLLPSPLWIDKGKPLKMGCLIDPDNSTSWAHVLPSSFIQQAPSYAAPQAWFNNFFVRVQYSPQGQSIKIWTPWHELVE